MVIRCACGGHVLRAEHGGAGVWFAIHHNREGRYTSQIMREPNHPDMTPEKLAERCTK